MLKITNFLPPLIYCAQSLINAFHEHYSTLIFSKYIEFLFQQKKAIRNNDKHVCRCLLFSKSIKYSLFTIYFIRLFIIGFVHALEPSEIRQLFFAYLPYIDPFFNHLLCQYPLFQFPYTMCAYSFAPLFFLYFDQLWTFCLDYRITAFVHQTVVLNRHNFFKFNTFLTFSSSKKLYRVDSLKSIFTWMALVKQMAKNFWFYDNNSQFSIRLFTPRLVNALPTVDDQLRVRLVLLTVILDGVGFFVRIAAGIY